MTGEGNKVWRLFSGQIKAYVKMFEEAEIEWTDRLLCHINVRRDMPFVRTLDPDDRVFFWMDKFTLYGQMHNMLFLLLACQRDYATGVYDAWTEFDEECLFILFLFVNRQGVPRTWLTRQLRARFSYRFSSGNPLAGRPSYESSVRPVFRTLPVV